MIGKRYVIPENNKKSIKELFRQTNAHKAAMNHHAEALESISSSLWSTIGELLPEIDVNKYIYGYDSETDEVVCVRKAPKI